MKKVYFILLFSVLLFIGIQVHATTTEEVPTPDTIKLVNPGIKPKSFFYGLDRFFEKVSLKFTFSDEKRVDKYTRFAEERLAELNTLNSEKDQKWIDQLYDDYGRDLLSVNHIIDKSIVKKKSKSVIYTMQSQLGDIVTKENLVKQVIRDQINDEVKSQVKNIKIQSYLSAISSTLTEDDLTLLENYSIGDSIKIKALSELSGMSVGDVMNLDVYNEDDPATDVIEKTINYEKLETVLGLSKDDLITELQELHKAINQNRTGNNGKSGQDNGNSDQQIDDIQQKIQDHINGNGNNNGNNNGSNGNKGGNK